MLVIRRIIEVFMVIGSLPAILIVVPFEELSGVDIAGTWISGMIAFCFGVLISAVFVFGVIQLVT